MHQFGTIVRKNEIMSEKRRAESKATMCISLKIVLKKGTSQKRSSIKKRLCASVWKNCLK